MLIFYIHKVTPAPTQLSLTMTLEEKENLESDLPPHQQMGVLTFAEKKFLLAVERGDVASTRR